MVLAQLTLVDLFNVAKSYSGNVSLYLVFVLGAVYFFVGSFYTLLFCSFGHSSGNLRCCCCTATIGQKKEKKSCRSTVLLSPSSSPSPFSCFPLAGNWVKTVAPEQKLPGTHYILLYSKERVGRIV